MLNQIVGKKNKKTFFNIGSKKSLNTNNISNKILKNFNLKPFGGSKDLDFDGVINRKDCQPRNTMRQDKLTQQQIANREEANYWYKNPKKLQIYQQGMNEREEDWKTHARPKLESGNNPWTASEKAEDLCHDGYSYNQIINILKRSHYPLTSTDLIEIKEICKNR